MSTKNQNILSLRANTNLAFGETLKAARIQQKLTQADLAGCFGVSRQAILAWESNKARPDYEYLPRLCEILHLSLSDLFGIQESYSPRERKLIHHYRELNDDHQRTVDWFVRSLAMKQQEDDDLACKNAFRLCVQQPGSLAAGLGSALTDEDPTPIFVRISDKTDRVDAVVTVCGDSMLPDYHDGDLVGYTSTSTARPGDDVVVIWNGNAFIKRLNAQRQLYSVNPDPDLAFHYFGDGRDIKIVGKVNCIIDPEDLPNDQERCTLDEMYRDELQSFAKQYAR